jgi:hypothetical protein
MKKKKNNSFIMYQKSLLEDVEKEIMVLCDFKGLVENEIKTVSIHLSTAKALKNSSTSWNPRNPDAKMLYKLLKGYYLRIGYDILHIDKKLSDYYLIQKYLQNTISGSDAINNCLSLYQTQIQLLDTKILDMTNDIKQYKTKDQLQTLIIFKLFDNYLRNIINNVFQ